ncbi:hypothetical protein, partial [[Clostridium] scindens]|uniref:hypothetical protein n=1 Tax=Clostridium scindens (strain JCM 10418 / VPI 12708) TaxID=29347 RepID=UPI0039F04E10
MRSESKQLRLSWESHIIPYLGGEIIEKSMGMISYNHHFKWWFSLSPPKGYCYCSPRRAVSQALLLVRYKAAP